MGRELACVAVVLMAALLCACGGEEGSAGMEVLLEPEEYSLFVQRVGIPTGSFEPLVYARVEGEAEEISAIILRFDDDCRLDAPLYETLDETANLPDDYEAVDEWCSTWEAHDIDESGSVGMIVEIGQINTGVEGFDFVAWGNSPETTVGWFSWGWPFQ